MSIEVLRRTFPTTDNPGLDTLDPRWGEISDLAQAGKFAEAAAGAADVLGQDVCDVRLVGYVCMGEFIERGVAALGDIFDAVGDLLRNSWGAVGPKDGREKAAQTSLGWLLEQVNRRLKREEDTKGPAWTQWVAGVSPETVDNALGAADRLAEAAGTALQQQAPNLLKKLTLTQSWLKGFRNVVYRPPEPEPETAPSPAEVQAVDTVEPEAAVPSAADARPAAVAVAGSPHLQVLKKKLDAFARLVKAGKFARALMVADDIQQTLSAFDPLLYFPDLFAGHMKLIAQNSNDIAQQEGMRDSPEWKALLGLYRVDIEAFVNL